MIHPQALIGEPPQHREWPARARPLWPVIDVTARVEAFAQVDAGMFRATTIGAQTWLMKMVHVGHDTIIGADCELAPGTVICGECEIGDRVRLGVNSCVIPRVKIGDGARIGAGAVVTHDVPAGEVWVGNPAEEISVAKARRQIRLEMELWEEWWRDRAREVKAA